MNKVANEVALDEFNRMLTSFDVDLEGLDKEDSENFSTLKAAIVRAIERGQITVDESGLPTVHLKYPVDEVSSVIFKHPTGDMIAAMGDKKVINTHTAGYRMMADMTGQPSVLFGKMRVQPDLRVCQGLVAVFLG